MSFWERVEVGRCSLVLLSERSLSKCSLQILTEPVRQGALHCLHRSVYTTQALHLVPYVMPELIQHPGSIHQPRYNMKTGRTSLHLRYPNPVFAYLVALVFTYCT
jgi:hypothetical protein